MDQLLRDVLLLVIAAVVLTAAASGVSWWRQEPRQLRRALRRALGSGAPDAMLIAHGRGAAIDLASGRAAVAWAGGASLLVRPLETLQGAELIVDEQVAARAHREEARRAMDQLSSGAEEIVLRLVFDDARDPDFQILLWRAAGGPDAQDVSARDAIEEGQRWLARADVILRRPRAHVASREEARPGAP